MEKRDLDGLKQNHVKQLSQTPQTWCVGKSSSPRSCELCLTVHGEVSSWGKHRETDKKSPTPFQNLYPGKTVLHSTEQAKKKGEHFVALSSGKDTLGDGRKQGSKFSSWALWYCRSLRSLKDSEISMTNENKYRKNKGNILIPPASSPMNDRNMKTQKRYWKWLSFTCSLLCIQRQWGVQSHKVLPWQKAREKTGGRVSIGLKVEQHPHRKPLK